MNKLTKLLLSIVVLVAFQQVSAVRLSDNTEGQALIFPYYSVQNDLTSYITIENNSGQYKAIKISIREGFNGYAVLNFALYLPPHEVWSGQLVAAVSSISGYEGQPSAQLITTNQGCTPYLASTQEMLPYEITNDTADNNMMRSQSGFIKIVEMGEVIGNHADGIENDCSYLTNSWNYGGQWELDADVDITAATGGLSGSMLIEHEMDGHQFVYPAIAIEDFYDAGEFLHSNPGNTPPFYANTLKNQLVLNSQAQDHTWQTAYEASSASFMRTLLSGQFLSNQSTSTEMVLTFPTKNAYVNYTNPYYLPPFTEHFQSNGACETIPTRTYDNNGVLEPMVNPQAASLCRSVNVLGFNHANYPATPYLLEQYHNVIDIQSELGTVEFDFSHFATAEVIDAANNNERYVYFGLPVIGVIMHRVEAGGNTALTMQEMTHSQHIVTDLIFEDGF